MKIKDKKVKSEIRKATGFDEKKKIPWIIFVIAAIVILLACLLCEKLLEEKSEKKGTKVEMRWNTDAALVDDRLDGGSPIFYALQPNINNGIVSVTALCLHNDGTYKAQLMACENYDVFQDEIIKDAPFLQNLKNGYEKSKEEEQLIADNKKPTDLREGYLKMYDVDDFSLTTETNMSIQNQMANGNILYMYAVTYDESLIPKSHLIYMKSGYTEKVITSELAQEAMGDISNVLAEDVLDSIKN